MAASYRQHIMFASYPGSLSRRQPARLDQHWI